ncbi:MAG TPA: HAMP domain-containing sensor histidine kinase [Acidimicrobiales bacterium]|nr:HAMP domain-containing sensor histidine kinase [Acidimicrobiales bacterium]
MNQLSRSERVTLAIVAIAVLAGGIAPSAAPRSLGTALMYDAAVLASATFALAGALRLPAERRRDWWFMPVAVTLLFGGDVIRDIYIHALHRSAPLPSSADVFSLAAYPLLLVGLLHLVRTRTVADRVGAALDVGTLAMAMALLVWEPLLVGSGRSLAGSIVAGAYPVFDVVLVGFAALLVGARRTSQSTMLLLGGAGALFIADLTYLVLSSTGHLDTDGFSRTLLVAGLFLLAASPWLDTAADAQPAPRRRPRTIAATVLVMAALVALPIDFGLDDPSSAGSHEPVVRLLLRILLLAFVAARLLRQALRNEQLVTELENTSTRLQELDDVRDGFFAQVGHEVRSPLGAIGTAAAVLRDHGAAMDPDAARELAAGIAQDARRLGRLTSDLVDASRGGHGTFPCEMHRIDDVGAIVATAAMTAAGAQRERVCIAVTPDVALRGDADRISQVVTNLVTNALKYSEGAVEVCLSREGTAAVLKVSDHGPGIPADQTHRLFERFARIAPDGDGPRPPGTGLGLFITRQVVHAHDGTVDHVPTPGGGAAFEVRLPCSA